MATRVERGGIEECVKKINSAIEQLTSAATEINSSMDELLLTTTVPEAVGNFRDYINQCMEKIIEIDEQLAGN